MRGIHSERMEVRGGLDIWVSAPPRQRIEPPSAVDCVALETADHPGVRGSARVDVGEHVRVGQTLFVDTRRPEIAFTSPATGVVRELRFGPHRHLHAVVVALDEAPPVPPGSVATPGADGASARAALLAHGLWPALRVHPTGALPDPGALPDRILVTAMDTRPLAPDARPIIDAHRVAFDRGVRALGALGDARVTVCQAPGPPLSPDAVSFRGHHPAGLPGTHARRLCGSTRAPGAPRVWHIGYQDTIAIGYLFGEGRLWTERVISLAGPAVREPRLCTVPLGARLRALTADGLDGAHPRILSGSVLGGREAEFLGRYHLQISVLHRAPRPEPGVIVPVAALERAAPDCPAPVPLLRALSVGDTESAMALGALDLAEEDLALLSHACASRTDYGPLLRAVRERPHAGQAQPATDPAGRDEVPDRVFAFSGLGLWRIHVWYALALLVPLGAVALHSGRAVLASFGTVLLVVLGWQFLFGLLRQRPVGRLTVVHAGVWAASLAVMLPGHAAPWQVALGTSFGVIFAEQVFGGYGFSFVNPVLVALVFLDASFSTVGYGAAAPLSAVHVIPGALLLLSAGIVSWRTLAALLFACAAVVLAGGAWAWPTGERLGTLLFVVLFFGCDPVSGAATRGGRWLYGLGAGALLGVSLDRGSEALALPLLAAQIFAPLLDRIALWRPRAARERSHG